MDMSFMWVGLPVRVVAFSIRHQASGIKREARLKRAVTSQALRSFVAPTRLKCVVSRRGRWKNKQMDRRRLMRRGFEFYRPKHFDAAEVTNRRLLYIL